MEWFTLEWLTSANVIFALVNFAVLWRTGDSRQKWFNRVCMALFLTAAVLHAVGQHVLAAICVFLSMAILVAAWRLKMKWLNAKP